MEKVILMDTPNSENFEFLDYLELGDWVLHPQLSVSEYPQNHTYVDVANEMNYSSGSSSSHHLEPAKNGTSVVKTASRESRSACNYKEIKERVAFKTKTEIEVLDDGFKWRKYGKKKVKNSPNPRNYYKCSVEDCPVKKRVERDSEDNGILITTYEGVHTHESFTRF